VGSGPSSYMFALKLAHLEIFKTFHSKMESNWCWISAIKGGQNSPFLV
jgi:hypothetical protein